MKGNVLLEQTWKGLPHSTDGLQHQCWSPFWKVFFDPWWSILREKWKTVVGKRAGAEHPKDINVSKHKECSIFDPGASSLKGVGNDKRVCIRLSFPSWLLCFFWPKLHTNKQRTKQANKQRTKQTTNKRGSNLKMEWLKPTDYLPAADWVIKLIKVFIWRGSPKWQITVWFQKYIQKRKKKVHKKHTHKCGYLAHLKQEKGLTKLHPNAISQTQCKKTWPSINPA